MGSREDSSGRPSRLLRIVPPSVRQTSLLARPFMYSRSCSWTALPIPYPPAFRNRSYAVESSKGGTEWPHPPFSPLPTALWAVGRGEKNPCPLGNGLRKSYGIHDVRGRYQPTVRLARVRYVRATRCTSSGVT